MLLFPFAQSHIHFGVLVEFEDEASSSLEDPGTDGFIDPQDFLKNFLRTQDGCQFRIVVAGIQDFEGDVDVGGRGWFPSFRLEQVIDV
jgi:hypothetical protein